MSKTQGNKSPLVVPEYTGWRPRPMRKKKARYGFGLSAGKKKGK